jgi:hypothetical protein
MAIPSGRRRWQLVLILLVALPFLPELAIRVLAGAAHLSGCAAADPTPCTIGPLSLGAALRGAIQGAVAIAAVLGFGGVIVWLWLAFVAVHRGFPAMAHRLVIAFLVTVALAYLPYLAPGLAVADLMHADCQPHDAGVGACRIFGTAMGRAPNETQVVQWFAFTGGPIALVMFAVYAFIAATRTTSATPKPSARA